MSVLRVYVLQSLFVLVLLTAGQVQAAPQFSSHDIVVGDGVAATLHSKVSVHYTGWLADGTKFDSSVDRGQTFQFTIGLGEVIPGWERGLVGMRVGGKRELIIPPQLAYGKRGAGGTIPPDATLKFEIELVGVVPPRYRNIDNGELKALKEKGVKIVDLRTPGEWKQTGVVENSKRITAFDENGRFRADFLGKLKDYVSKDEDVVLICRSGNRSSMISQFLSQKMGYSRVHNVKDGIVSWMRDGNPVVK